MTISSIQMRGGFGVQLPYDKMTTPLFNAEMKQKVPNDCREWFKPYWVFDQQYSAVISQLVDKYYHSELALPHRFNVSSEVQVLLIQYVTRCKPRTIRRFSGTGALCWIDGWWRGIIPENVLRDHFMDTPESETYYTYLGVQPTISQDDLKKAYRRSARMWHPDVNKEQGAEEMFKRVNEAYQVLSDPNMRKKYDNITYLIKTDTEGTKERQSRSDDKWGYRSPLTCGLVTCEGIWAAVGKFQVTKIISWQDVLDARGRMMVSSWPKTDIDSGTKSEPKIEWI